MSAKTRIPSIFRAASMVAVLALTSPPAHAAPAVWNVNIGDDVTTSDNFAGAAVENTTPNSFWNSFVAADLPSAKVLADPSGNPTSVTMQVTADTLPTIGNNNQVGDKIFNNWMKASSNSVDFTVTFANLSPGDTYDLVIYADWFWQEGAIEITQTAGTGLAAPFVLNYGKTIGGASNDTGPLSEDTNPANVGSGTLNWNYTRLKTLTPDAGGNLAFLIDGGNWPISGFQLVKLDLADNTPPTPNPATWATLPVAVGEASVTMTATTASDPNGVEYFFTETSGNPGGTSSGWQDNPTYIDTGLQPGTTYTYTVKSRDKSPAQNETVASSGASATTDATDSTAPTPDPMSFAVAPVAASITKITMTATTASDINGVEYYFTETSGNPGGTSSGWQDSPVYTDGGLTPGTSYTYTVKARDKSQAKNETAASGPASASTPAEGVVSRVWNVNIGDNLDESDNFVGAAPENIQNSFWNSVTTAIVTAKPLADSTNSLGAGVTLDLTGPTIGYANFADISGPDIFDAWIKSSDNATPFTMVIGGLSTSKTYDLIVYSDWFWKDNGTLPLTQTAGTGLSGTAVLDQISSGENGIVPGLVEDTDLGPNSAVEGNWIRINGLVPDEQGNLAFTMGGTNAAFNGFQLVHPRGLITSFGIPGYPGVIDQKAKTISLTVSPGTNLATLAPEFTLSPGATCNQTSGSPPSPTFAAQNPATYTVTDTSTDPVTVNNYAVTVIVPPPTASLVIDLGTSPAGTTIAGGTFIGTGPTNLPLPTLPAGSILRSIAVSAKLEATDNDNYASDLSLLLDPTPGAPGGDFSVEITNGITPLGGTALNLDWPATADGGEGTELIDTKTDANWAAVAPIDLATTGLFLGNAFGGPTVGGTWSGTITLTYDLVSPSSPYDTWSGGQPFANDSNGDGVKNGLAFLLGAAGPNENALNRLPVTAFVSGPSGGLVMEFDCLAAADRGGATLVLQHSSNLGGTDPWTGAPVPGTVGTSTVNHVDFVVTDPGEPGGLLHVVATVQASQAASGRLFGRLSGSEN
jgi:hypothetical protein